MSQKAPRRGAPRKAAPRSARIRKKAPRNQVRPNYLLLFYLFVISAFVSGTGAYALKTPSLNIKEIKISGVELCDRCAVKKAAGSVLGENILLLRKKPVVSRIASLPEVREVTMGRTLPNSTWVKVCERRADSVLASGGGFGLMQGDGLVFHRVKKPVKDLPVIEIAKREALKPGKKVCSEDAYHALQVLHCAHGKGLRPAKISVDHDGDICLNMNGDFLVKLGQPDDIMGKMSKLRNALVCRPSIAWEAEYIDLSCPSAAVLMPKQVAAGSSY